MTVALLGWLAGCGSGEPSDTAVLSSASFGTCARVPEQLIGDPIECMDDTECPCGAFCGSPNENNVRYCDYECIPPDVVLDGDLGAPWGDPATCSVAGEACNDRGRCEDPTPSPLPGYNTVLDAEPRMRPTIAGGDPETFDVELRLSDTVVGDADDTVVTVSGRQGAQVSCDEGGTFGASCTLTGWAFIHDGALFRAKYAVQVQTPAGTVDGLGEVQLHNESSGAEILVATPATTPPPTPDGNYSGAASSATSTQIYPGVPITARVRGDRVLITDPTRVLAPDGAILLDLTTDPDGELTGRYMRWLRGLDADATAGAIVAEYYAGPSTVDAAAGTIRMPVRIDVPGTAGLNWNLDLTRIDEQSTAACTGNAQCKTDEVCEPTFGACVPSSFTTPPAGPEGNSLDDDRSARWWAKVQPSLQAPASTPAYATSGPALVESVLCSGSAVDRGQLGVDQMKQLDPNTNLLVSRSGDLACVNSLGSPNNVAGAIGMATLADRTVNQSAVELQSGMLLEACAANLALEPSASLAFDSGTAARCVNLARFVPALRLLATGEVAAGAYRATQADREPRARGLLVRLVQQWGMLHGFLAAAGGSQRDYEDAITSSASPAQRREAFLELLDLLDQGWGALLDRQVFAAVRDAARWAPTGATDLGRDYRWLKQPVAYWTFRAGDRGDLIHDLEVVAQDASSDPARCAPTTTQNSWIQEFDCSGLQATLPEAAPSLLDDPEIDASGEYDNLTVTINVDALDTALVERAYSSENGESQLRAKRGGDVPQGRNCPPGGCDDPPDDDPPDDDDDGPHRPPRPPAGPPYRGGTLIALESLAVAETVAGAPTIVVAHPYAGGVELVTFTDYGALGNPSTEAPDGPQGRGDTLTLVRDADQKTYTLHVWDRATSQMYTQTKPYFFEPSGALDFVGPKQVRLGAAWTVPTGHYWAPYKRSYPGFLDDIAIFDSALSPDEVKTYSSQRGYLEKQRFVWPRDMVLNKHGTQEIVVPLGAQLLETQVAHLEVVARLQKAMLDQAYAACEDPDATAALQADLARTTARIGRTIRQSYLVESLAELDVSDRADEARALLEGVRTEITRGLQPIHCRSPFEMAADEVPLYFDSPNAQTSESQAYFAASDHLEMLAGGAINAAVNSRQAAESAWVAARQSQIQQLEHNTQRQQRLQALTEQYGDGLRRLCGLEGEYLSDIVASVTDPEAGQAPLSAETCFVEPSTRCLDQHDGSIEDADPACYRGQIGMSLMELRAAYFAYKAAHNSWQAAVQSSEAASHLCALKQIDEHGCTVSNRELLTDPKGCKPGYEGTRTLALEFVKERQVHTGARSVLGGIGGGLATFLSGYAQSGGTNPLAGASLLSGIIGGFTQASTAALEGKMESRRLQHEEVLRHRSAEDAIRSCWNQAEQYARAITSAEEAAKQALAQFEAATIAYDNAINEARQLVLEMPAVFDRERNEPSIPIAFHHWLDDKTEDYQSKLEIARRYLYLYLRAVEYDEQETMLSRRSVILGASHPNTLSAQFAALTAMNNDRKIRGAAPERQVLAFDFVQRFYGQPISSSETGAKLLAHAQDVYTRTGIYLGKGIKFTMAPPDDESAGNMRCGERIWRVNVGATHSPDIWVNASSMHLRLIKRNVFSSRKCMIGTNDLQQASVRPNANLLVGDADASTYDVPADNTTADMALQNVQDLQVFSDFRQSESYLNGSSIALAGQGLYGEYILLFPRLAIEQNQQTPVPLQISNLRTFNLRFDVLSAADPDNNDVPGFAPRIELEIDESVGPIIVDE